MAWSATGVNARTPGIRFTRGLLSVGWLLRTHALVSERGTGLVIDGVPDA